MVVMDWKDGTIVGLEVLGASSLLHPDLLAETVRPCARWGAGRNESSDFRDERSLGRGHLVFAMQNIRSERLSTASCPRAVRPKPRSPLNALVAGNEGNLTS